MLDKQSLASKESLSESVDKQSGHHEKRMVALNSVFAAVFLTGIKIFVGIFTGSLGILAEAAHSALDMVAAVVTYFAVRFSGRPPDQDHQYGHGKIENLSALFETILLFITCIWIIYESIERLFFHPVAVEASIWAFIVMVISIVVDYTRSQLLFKTAKKYNSQALAADALHFSTDIWSSSIVIVGLICVWLSTYFKIPWLVNADAVAALGVSLIIIYISFKMGKQTIDVLLDGVSDRLADDVSSAAASVTGVTKVKKVRVRRSGPEVFADIVILISRDTDLIRSHDISREVKIAVRTKLQMPDADVMIHIDPSDPNEDGTLETLRALAKEQHLLAHDIRIRNVENSMLLELHLGVPDFYTVKHAHAKATVFEESVKKAFPEFNRIITHLEPISDERKKIAQQADHLDIHQIVYEVCNKSGKNIQAHDIESLYQDGELNLHFHCTMTGDLNLEYAHNVTELLEKALRSRIPNLGRVMIHIEPFESQR
ncbi:MAG: cation diffusion facilitator family transporter [Desulfobacterales bacterium]|nr:cation diffusion facilitator family transporter [Desulfobacterales bacterium]